MRRITTDEYIKDIAFWVRLWSWIGVLWIIAYTFNAVAHALAGR